MKSPADCATHFESVKIAMTQDKNGYVLKLSIHPNDVPESIMRDLVGSRYMVAMVKLDDQNEPVEPPEKRKTDRLFAAAGALCRQEKFWAFLEDKGLSYSVSSEAEAANALRIYLNISSRKEIKTNNRARDTFGALLDEFKEWAR